MKSHRNGLDTTEILRRQRARELGKQPINSGTLYDILPTLAADLLYLGLGFVWVLFFLIVPIILIGA